MASSAFYFLYAFAFILWAEVRSQGTTQDSCSVCVLKDAPTQCGAFVHAALLPLIDAFQENQEKLEEIGRHINIEREATSRNFQTLVNRMNDQQSAMERKMESQMTSLQNFFLSQLKEIKDHQKQELRGLEIDIYHVQDNLSKIFKKPRPKFEKIGSRKFYIANHIAIRWTSALIYCRTKGGYLASIQSEEELAAISARLGNAKYWVSTNDREEEGKFVSVTTGKPAPFLKWEKNAPKNETGNEDCVHLNKGLMRAHYCNSNFHFICQENKI